MTDSILKGGVELDTTKAENSLDKVSGKVSGLNKTFSTAGKALGVLGAGVAGAATAAFKFVDDYTGKLDAIDEGSQRVGLSTKAYQEWNHVLSMAGTSIDVLEVGSKKLTQAMAAARDGGESQIAIFDKLKVSYKNTDGSLRNMSDVMPEVITALSGVTNVTERNSMANEILGKSGMALIPVFNMGKDAIDKEIKSLNESGAVMSGPAVDAGVKFQDTMDRLKATLGGVFGKIAVDLIPCIEQLINAMMPLIPVLVDIIKQLMPMVSQLLPVFVDLAKALIPVILDLIKALMPVVIELLPVFIDLIKAILPIIPLLVDALLPIIKMILPLLVDLLKAVSWVITNVVIPALTAIVTAFKWVFTDGLKYIQDLYNNIVTWCTNVKTSITTTWNAIIGFFSNTWNTIYSGITSAWNNIKINITTMATNVYNAVLTPIRNIISGISNIWNTVYSGVTSAWTNISTNIYNWVANIKNKVLGVFDTLKNKIGEIWGGLSGIVKSAFNSVIRVINWAIGKINSVQISIPSWVPLIGGSSYGFNIPQIPLLAQGGIVSSPTLAMIGESGPEAVVPLGKNNNYGGSTTIIIELDGKVIAKNTLEKMPGILRLRGVIA